MWRQIRQRPGSNGTDGGRQGVFDTPRQNGNERLSRDGVGQLVRPCPQVSGSLLGGNHECRLDQFRQPGRNAGDGLVQRHVLASPDGLQHRSDVGATKWPRSGQEFVEDDPHREHVARGRRFAAFDELRCRVAERAQHCAGRRDPFGAPVNGGAEIAEHHVAPIRQQDVARFDITVHDSEFVERGEPARHRNACGDDLADRQLAVSIENVGQCAAAVVHHRVPGATVGLTHVDDADHVGVVESRKHTGLGDQPMGLLSVPADQRLDRDKAAERGLPRQVHRAGTAAADFIEDLVALNMEHGGTLSADWHPAATERRCTFLAMRLWLVVDTPESTQREVDVALGSESSVRDLILVLLGKPSTSDTVAGHRLYSHRLHEFLDPSLTMQAADVRFGDHLVLADAAWNPPDRPRHRTGSARIQLTLIGGPSTGRCVPLGVGDHIIGRSIDADVTIDDPALSRKHLRVTVTDAGVSIRDEESSNGTFVGEASVDSEQEVPIGTVVGAGHSLLRIDAYEPSAAVVRTGPDGLVGFNRPPRHALPAAAPTFHLDPPPERGGRRRLSTAVIFGPLVVGVPLVVVSLLFGRGDSRNLLIAMGLVTALSSPILSMLNHVGERRSTTTQHREGTANFRRRLDEVAGELASALAALEGRLRRLSPDAADLIERAQRLRSNLWERRPSDPDFMQFAVGFADRPSGLELIMPPGGDEQLRSEVTEEASAWDTAHNVPIVVDLASAGVAGLCGERRAVMNLASWIAVQFATLTSPRDVVIAGAFDDVDDDLELARWMTWLPHARAHAPGTMSNWIHTGEQAAALLEELDRVIKKRSETTTGWIQERSTPEFSIVAFISDRVDLPRQLVNPVLERGPEYGVYVVWLGDVQDDLPGSSGAVVRATSDPATALVSWPVDGTTVGPGLLDQLDRDAARSVARSLSGVRDITVGDADGLVPTSIGLATMLGLTDLEPAARSTTVARNWSERSSGLGAPMGYTASGPLDLDLRRDGPHSLVGGTTGAGKSELLQSWIASLAAFHPPERLTFVLVDYKGGAAFKDIVKLPHTVGLVTDLDGHLVRRALDSLNAELRYREHVLRDHGCRDLIELEGRDPGAAPPALVLAVDEFAALVNELPDFVDGVVNIAQRGRSLGIHLILATQRPAGAINDNIRANTNLRIALRMNDAADSDDVIDARDAAQLPRDVPGRAFVRRGAGDLVEVQAAFGGGHELSASRESTTAQIHELILGGPAEGSGGAYRPPAVAPDTATDLQLLVESINEAAVISGSRPPRSPLLAPLPTIVTLGEIVESENASDSCMVVGIADRPHDQVQVPLAIDLDTSGSLLIAGSSGSGKTTLLRTMVAHLTTTCSADECHVYGIDAAGGGLMTLESLPHVGGMVPVDDSERVQSLVTRLEREVARRQIAITRGGSTSWKEARAAGGALPRLVVLLDGFGEFVDQFETVEHGAWVDRVVRLVGSAPNAGISWIVTGTSRASFPARLLSSIGTRLVLRMNEPDEYGMLGLDQRRTRDAVLPPGRGFTDESLDFHAAIVGRDPSGAGQVAAIEALASRLSSPSAGSLPEPIERLAQHVELASIDQDPSGRLCAVIGIDQLEHAGVEIDLDNGNFFIAGPVRSGKSTALATLAHGIRNSTPDVQLVLLAPRRSPLTSVDGWSTTAAGLDACSEATEELIALMTERSEDADPMVVVVDDAAELADTACDEQLAQLARRGSEHGIYVIAAADNASARRSYGGLIAQIRRGGHGLLLMPDPDLDGDLLSASVPRRPKRFWAPGRALLVSREREGVIQVGISPNSSTDDTDL